jgi:uncharacterized membrane protein SpoIIM required for sporulation
MLNNKAIFFLILSFIIWSFPFILRIFFWEIPENDMGIEDNYQESIEVKITKMFEKGNLWPAFLLIFSNNIKSCIINIFGGVMFGLATLLNLFINGFYSADMFVRSYKAGLSIKTIFKITLPHSFELIGFWLSGAIGFYIAWNIIQFMRGKESFTVRFYKQVGFYSLAVFFIILAAAYVEAYISTSFITQ